MAASAWEEGRNGQENNLWGPPEQRYRTGETGGLTPCPLRGGRVGAGVKVKRGRGLRVKVLCLLAALLCLSAAAGKGMVPVSAEFSDSGAVKNKEAVELLTAIGVINGFGDNTFRPSETLTRAQGATIVAKLMGHSVATLPKSCGFTDVQDWAVAAVGYCEREGIVSGVGEGRFDPNGTLTGAAFAKMLLCSLGYNAEMEGLTGIGWSNSTTRLAGSVSLNGSVSTSNTAITRDDACQLAFQALTVPRISYSGRLKSATGGYLADSFGLGVRSGSGLTRREFSAESRIEGVVVLNGSNSSDAARQGLTMIGSGSGGNSGLVYSISSGMNLLAHKVTLYKQAGGSCLCLIDRSDGVQILSADAMGRDAVVRALGNVSLDEDFRAVGGISVASDGATRNVISAPAGTYVLQGSKVVGAIAAGYVSMRADKVSGVYPSGIILRGLGTLYAGTYSSYAGIKNGDIILVEDVEGARTLAKARTVSGTLDRITRRTLLTMNETRYIPSEITDSSGISGDLWENGVLSRELDFATYYTLYLDGNGAYFAITSGGMAN